MNLDALYQQACQTQDSSLASDLFARILAQDPTYPNAAFHWGRHRHLSGDMPQAEALYVQELRHRPDFWGCRANLAQLYKEQKRFQEALNQIQQAQRDCSQADFQVELLQLEARIHRALEQYSEAARCLQVALQIAPGADLYRDAARNALALNQFNQASHYYQRAILFSQELKTITRSHEASTWLQKLPSQAQSLSEFKNMEVIQTVNEIQIVLPAIGIHQVPLMGYLQYRLYFLAYLGPILVFLNFYRMPSPSLMAFSFIYISAMIGFEIKCFDDYANSSNTLYLRDTELVIETKHGKKYRQKIIERDEFKGAAAYLKNGKDIQLHIHALADKSKPEQIGIGQKLSKEEQEWLCTMLFLWRSQGAS